ncbi:urease accessory UreF family protein [Cognatishimia sp. SS12]|nr:urease accessory UreF family protein [Cognatishimia sp. SS12]
MSTAHPRMTIHMQDPMSTAIDPRLLTLTQWLSPAYPVGSFAFSHGLESAIANGWVHDEVSLQGWLNDLLHHGSGKADAIWIRLGYEAPDAAAVLALNAEAKAFAPAAERLREATRQGAAFAQITADVWQITLPPLLMPVALGRAAHLLGLDVTAATTLYLQAFVSNLASAAQRLMPLGQTGAQRVIAQMVPACLACARAAATAQLNDIASSAFLSDVAAMQHETLQPRLFQS